MYPSDVHPDFAAGTIVPGGSRRTAGAAAALMLLAAHGAEASSSSVYPQIVATERTQSVFENPAIASYLDNVRAAASMTGPVVRIIDSRDLAQEIMRRLDDPAKAGLTGTEIAGSAYLGIVDNPDAERSLMRTAKESGEDPMELAASHAKDLLSGAPLAVNHTVVDSDGGFGMSSSAGVYIAKNLPGSIDPRVFDVSLSGLPERAINATQNASPNALAGLVALHELRHLEQFIGDAGSPLAVRLESGSTLARELDADRFAVSKASELGLTGAEIQRFADARRVGAFVDSVADACGGTTHATAPAIEGRSDAEASSEISSLRALAQGVAGRLENKGANTTHDDPEFALNALAGLQAHVRTGNVESSEREAAARVLASADRLLTDEARAALADRSLIIARSGEGIPRDVPSLEECADKQTVRSTSISREELRERAAGALEGPGGMLAADRNRAPVDTSISGEVFSDAVMNFSPSRSRGRTPDAATERRTLAAMIFAEAGNQGEMGMAAVADVIANRAERAAEGVNYGRSRLGFSSTSLAGQISAYSGTRVQFDAFLTRRYRQALERPQVFRGEDRAAFDTAVDIADTFTNPDNPKFGSYRGVARGADYFDKGSSWAANQGFDSFALGDHVFRNSQGPLKEPSSNVVVTASFEAPLPPARPVFETIETVASQSQAAVADATDKGRAATDVIAASTVQVNEERRAELADMLYRRALERRQNLAEPGREQPARQARMVAGYGR